MDGISIFLDKEKKPSEQWLANALKASHHAWKTIYDFVLDQYPNAICEWNFPGKKYGWSYRMKDERRAIIYFIPQESQFQVAFVFGAKALNEIMKSDIQSGIKTQLSQARKYAEGTGIRIDVINLDSLEDIKKLIMIKLSS